jgi:hypothetical protein
VAVKFDTTVSQKNNSGLTWVEFVMRVFCADLKWNDQSRGTSSLSLPFAVFSKPNSSLFPILKIKLKGCHFDTTDVIEAESRTVLNTLTEHIFQDAFKHGRSAGNSAYTQKGTDYFEDDGGQKAQS